MNNTKMLNNNKDLLWLAAIKKKSYEMKLDQSNLGLSMSDLVWCMWLGGTVCVCHRELYLHLCSKNYFPKISPKKFPKRSLHYC